ncbi:MAG: type I-D CRISPR-associated helicase Cas3', partial [Blastocatellia bacterium]
LLHLLDRPNVNVLFIAPTNELIRQHARDVERFVADAGLPHLVVELNARLLREFDPQNELRRQGERFHRLLENPLQFADELNIPEEKRDTRFPIVLVTNPDIFYYALYFGYNRKDARNVFYDVFGHFDYVVIDEFHYYNPKQLSNFLFYFALSLGLGYFRHGRKICLLSATPSMQLHKYLDWLAAQGMKYTVVSPQPVVPDDPLAVRTLAPVELTFTLGDNEVNEYVTSQARTIRQLIDSGQDGAIISNSLRDIIQTALHLRANGFGEADYRRITGPYKDRGAKPLVLATPTVDIGYNFEGRAKQRQNLDFVIFTAPSADAFWQRLGRAGRVLGKSEIDTPSQATCIVPLAILTDVRKKLAEVSQPLTRQELKNKLGDAIPELQPLFDYFRSFAISESFLPIYKLSEMMSDRQQLLEQLFELVRGLFAPKSKRSYASLCRFARRYTQLQSIVEENSNSKPHQNIVKLMQGAERSRYTPIIREFIDAQQQLAQQGKGGMNENAPSPIPDGRVADWGKALESKPKIQSLFNQYISEEFYAIRGLFNFRDSFGGLTVIAHDPQRIYVDQGEVVTYDLFHILRYCEAEFYENAQEFTSQTGCAEIPEGDFYCRLKGLREKPETLRLEFSLSSNTREFSNADEFERRYCNRPVATNGLRLTAKQWDGFAMVDHPLPSKITNAISKNFVPCLIVKTTGSGYGVIRRVASTQHILLINLNVTFDDSRCGEFAMIAGTQAYLVGAKLEKFFYAIQRPTQFYIC